MSIYELIIIGWVGVTVIMIFLYLFARFIKNAGIVDAGWAMGLALLAVFYASAAEGLVERRIVLALLGSLWGLRLACYLFFNRVLGKPEDGRYAMLREKWGKRAERNFFIFFLIQASWAVLFSLPFLAVVFNPTANLGILDGLGILIWILAVLGELTADWQLASFRGDEQNRGKTCTLGLWRYSRHPNYFFEWLHWFAYIPLAVGSPYWWISLLGPVTIGVFLFKITGIPYTEKQAMQKRGESYREYQRTTSSFFPWFPKKK